MNPPARRKSSLAGSSPTAPPPTTPVSTPAPAPEPRTERTTAGEPGKPTKFRPRVTFYQDSEATARVRAAWLHTQTIEGPRSLSQFIERAVMTEVARLERQYNNGDPWPAIGAHEVPRGRPVGS